MTIFNKLCQISSNFVLKNCENLVSLSTHWKLTVMKEVKRFRPIFLKSFELEAQNMLNRTLEESYFVQFKYFIRKTKRISIMNPIVVRFKSNNISNDSFPKKTRHKTACKKALPENFFRPHGSKCINKNIWWDKLSYIYSLSIFINRIWSKYLNNRPAPQSLCEKSHLRTLLIIQFIILFVFFALFRFFY